MKKNLFSVMALGAMMFVNSLFAAGPMKDIELTPGKKTDEGYWMTINTQAQNGSVTFQYSVDAQVTLRLFDLSGREVDPGSTGTVKAGHDYQSEVDFSNFQPGVYFAQLSSNGGPTVLTKFVISR